MAANITSFNELKTGFAVIERSYDWDDQSDDFYIVKECSAEAEAKKMADDYNEASPDTYAYGRNEYVMRCLSGKRRLILTDRAELQVGLALRPIKWETDEHDLNGFVFYHWRADCWWQYLLYHQALNKRNIKSEWLPGHWEQYHGPTSWNKSDAREGDVVVLASNFTPLGDRDWVKLQYTPEFERALDRVEFSAYVVEKA